MSKGHTDVGPELRRLAQAIVDGIDPAVRAAATMALNAGTGKCQQVWCPVCALAAVVNGEQHPLLTVIANHSVALLEVIQSIVDDLGPTADGVPPPAPDEAPADGLITDPSPTGNGATKTGYQAIPVIVQE